MNKNILNVNLRTTIRKKSFLNGLRSSGYIPGVIYGKSKNINIQLKENNIKNILKLLSGKTAIIKINIEEQKNIENKLYLIKDIQTHKYKNQLLHVDFKEIFENELLKTVVPIKFIGESPGVKNDKGVLTIFLHYLKIISLPKNVPDSIIINIENVLVGSSIHISDLTNIENVKIDEDKDRVILTCTKEDEQEEDDISIKNEDKNTIKK